MQVSYIMSDEAGIHIEPESDPFHDSNAPDLKHTNLSAKYLVRAMVQVTEKEIYLCVQDDERPVMPTDNVHLTEEECHITDPAGSRRESQAVGCIIVLV